MKSTKQIMIEGYALLPEFMANYGYRYSPIRTPMQLETDLVKRLIAADTGATVLETIYLDGVMMEPVTLTLENCEMNYSDIRAAMGDPLDVEFLTEANTGGASTFEEAPAEEVPVQPEEATEEPVQEEVTPEAPQTPAEEVPVKGKKAGNK